MMATKNERAILLIFFGWFVLLRAIEGHLPPCNADQFRCFNHKCIKRNFFCDNDNDCGDLSDERYCDFNAESCPFDPDIIITSTPSSNANRNRAVPLRYNQWLRCKNSRRCYPKEWKCDGVINCQDNSDETDCNAIVYMVGVKEARENLTSYFLNLRQPLRFIDKWSPHLLRTAVALFLSDSNFFSVGNRTGEEIAYEISLQLLSKLALQKKISTQELSLFVNALTVACINPKDFFGVNAVLELRKRANNSNVTNPFALLTLCNAGAQMTAEDVVELQQQFDAHYRPFWTDTQAVITMATACISGRSNVAVDERIIKEMVTELKKRQFSNGTVDNLRTTALVMQALLATNSIETDFDVSSAVKVILNEVKTKYVPINDLYYILPVLNSMSLVNISSKHCRSLRKTDLEVLRKLMEKPDERIEVKFSVYIGEDMDFIRTWKLKVPTNYTFYNLLENLGTLDPTYKVQYSVSDGKPYVTGLTKFHDDVVEGMFWFTYTQTLSETDSTLKLREESPVDIPVKATEEFILWYRSRVWAE